MSLTEKCSFSGNAKEAQTVAIVWYKQRVLYFIGFYKRKRMRSGVVFEFDPDLPGVSQYSRMLLRQPR